MLNISNTLELSGLFVCLGGLISFSVPGATEKIAEKIVVYLGWSVPRLALWATNHSVFQGISPTLKYWPYPFLLRPSQKILNLSGGGRGGGGEHPPPPTIKILQILTPPLYRTLIQKRKDSFCKETKDFISNIK